MPGTYITTLNETDLGTDTSGMPVNVLMGKADAIWDEVAATLAAYGQAISFGKPIDLPC